MILKTLIVGQLQTNCYLVACEKTGQGAIIDPGGDAARILAEVGDLEIRYVVDTHAHFDHVLGNRGVIEGLVTHQKTAPKLVVHRDDLPLLDADGGARWFGFTPIQSPKPDEMVVDGDLLTLGDLSFEVLHTPGHSPGSISLYVAAEHVLFAGDVLFRQGVGRTDLPGGDWHTLMRTIRDRFFSLPDDTVVYPGHGPSTTIEYEKRHNPFIDR
jgi:hydroxyacylglutathione hydrolase